MKDHPNLASLPSIGLASRAERSPFAASAATVIVVAVVLLVAAGLPLTGHTMSYQSLLASVIGLGALALPLALRRYRNDPRVFATVRGAALLLAFSAAGTVLSYLAVSTNAPLVDATLAAWDRALGFDWLAFSAWQQGHSVLFAGLQYAYYSGMPQLIFVVIFLGMSGRASQLDDFLCVYFVTVLLVIAISAPFPAECPWKYYGVEGTFDMAPTSHFEMLRDGRLREIPLGLTTQGLVSMPSLHAATAVLLVYAMRRTVLFPLFVALNAVMLFSTPIAGGHYLVDVLAGIALPLVLIAMRRRMARARFNRGCGLTAPGSALPGLAQAVRSIQAPARP